jgi:TolA-binding protein
MSDRLEQIERLVESNAKAILALTNQGIELNNKIDRTNAIVIELANIVYAVSNRQEDHEHRITRLEDRL